MQANRLAVVAILVALLAACSGGSDEAVAEDVSQTTESSQAVESTTPPDEPAATATSAPVATPPAAPTSTPTPTSIPEPTATPAPVEPIFEYVAPPEEAGFTRFSTRMYDAIEPLRDGNWAALGVRWNYSVGLADPLVWVEADDGSLVEEQLPLPERAGAAFAFDGTMLGDSRIITGHAFSPDGDKPALWLQTAPGEPWQAIDANVLNVRGRGLPNINAVLGNSEIAVLMLGDGRDPWKQAFTSTDGIEWQTLSLPDFDPAIYSLHWAHLASESAMLIANENDGDAQQTWIAASDYATWQLHPVNASDAAKMEETAVLDGSFVGTGRAEATGPHGFWLDAEGIWQSEPASFEGVAVANADQVDLSNLGRLDGRLRATLTVDGERTQMVSDDVINWEIDEDLDVGVVPDDVYDEAVRAAVRSDARSLVAQGSEPPLWLDSGLSMQATTVPAWPLERPRDPWTTLISHQDVFTMVARDLDDRFIWRQFDLQGDLSWDLVDSGDDAVVLSAGSSGDRIHLHVFGAEGGQAFRTRGGIVDFSNPINPSLLPDDSWQRANLVVPTSSGSTAGVLAAYAFGADSSDSTESVALVFASSDGTPELRPITLNGREGYEPVAICSGSSSGRTPVVINNDELVESQVLVWIGRREGALVEMAVPPGGGDRIWVNTLLGGCETLGDHYVLSGSVCEDADPEAICQPMVWVSTDGVSWDEHPQMAVLVDAEVNGVSAMDATGQGLIMAASQPSLEDDSLWLVSETTISRIRAGETLTAGVIQIDEIVSTSTHVVLRDGPSYFIASLEDVVARTDPAG